MYWRIEWVVMIVRCVVVNRFGMLNKSCRGFLNMSEKIEILPVEIPVINVDVFDRIILRIECISFDAFTDEVHVRKYAEYRNIHRNSACAAILSRCIGDLIRRQRKSPVLENRISRNLPDPNFIGRIEMENDFRAVILAVTSFRIMHAEHDVAAGWNIHSEFKSGA